MMRDMRDNTSKRKTKKNTLKAAVKRLAKKSSFYAPRANLRNGRVSFGLDEDVSPGSAVVLWSLERAQIIR